MLIAVFAAKFDPVKFSIPVILCLSGIAEGWSYDRPQNRNG